MNNPIKINFYQILCVIILVLNVVLTPGTTTNALQNENDTTGPTITVRFSGSMTEYDPGTWIIYIEDLQSGLAEVQILLNGYVISHEQQLNGVPSISYCSPFCYWGTTVIVHDYISVLPYSMTHSLEVRAMNNDNEYPGDQEECIYIETVTVVKDPGPVEIVFPLSKSLGFLKYANQVIPGRIIFPDGDSDCVCDAADNCPTLPNPNQWDSDGDGVGDVCEEPVGAPLLTDAILMLPLALLAGTLLVLLRRRKHPLRPNGEDIELDFPRLFFVFDIIPKHRKTLKNELPSSSSTIRVLK